jgi:acetyl-CoA carboxylase carboxyl transferase subunit beta
VTLERFFRRRPPQQKEGNSDDLPDLWGKCPKCGKQVYNKELEQNLRVCPYCGYHHRMPVKRRVESLADPGSFEQTSGQVRATDPLEFVDTEPYTSRLERSRKKTGREGAVVAGRATMGGLPVVLCIMDFEFNGGSMGSVEGEEITRSMELAAREHRALILVAASGGARMQEGALSLMQMAKTTFALEELAAQRLPYITILSDPTTGGVAASFAAIGDVIIGEPDALIGFAGQRVIQQTVRQNLPEGFQRSEFYEKKGFMDIVLDRREHRQALVNIISTLMRQAKPEVTPIQIAVEPPKPARGGLFGRRG